MSRFLYSYHYYLMLWLYQTWGRALSKHLHYFKLHYHLTLQSISNHRPIISKLLLSRLFHQNKDFNHRLLNNLSSHYEHYINFCIPMYWRYMFLMFYLCFHLLINLIITLLTLLLRQNEVAKGYSKFTISLC